MKNKIIGVFAVAFLLGSSIGFAANASLIGAKVTGMYSIEQGGKKIADAVIINGSAYVPVLAMSKATGTNLAVKGKTITVDNTETAKIVDTTISEKMAQIRIVIERNEAQIANLKGIQESGYRDEENSQFYKYETTESFTRTSAEILRLTTENEKLKEELLELVMK
ncbi:MAG: hypothetical protein K6T94_22410 [Paenibacillus sp.]|nr:hypothetical protein [Paenibacillus sp.]